VARLEQVVRKIPREEIRKALGKTKRMNILLTPQQKEGIRAAAERYGLSMTDYLIRLHALTEKHATEKGRK
jgi:uncharacterized protein (DUF1778 family)